MIRAYRRMHVLGFAHSLEVWAERVLVGGLYGLSLGGVFFGESMFSLLSGASKAAFLAVVRALGAAGFSLFDCQVATPHLEALGARNMPRTEFLNLLKRNLKKPTQKGLWTRRFPLPPL